MSWLAWRDIDATVGVRAGICATTLHDKNSTAKETWYHSRKFLC